LDENDLIKTGMEVILRPVTDIAENALGRMGGDWLSESRARNRAKLKQKTAKILSDAGVKGDVDPSPSVVAPLLSAAQDEGREDLLNVWAKLLAAALNPASSTQYRREFVEIVKQLEPVDVLVLPLLASSGSYKPSRIEFIASQLKRRNPEIELSIRNLLRLDVAMDNTMGSRDNWPIVTALGRELLTLVS
jgi:hypothetical protein